MPYRVEAQSIKENDYGKWKTEAVYDRTPEVRVHLSDALRKDIKRIKFINRRVIVFNKFSDIAVRSIASFAREI